jgi:hypothetical protein
MNQRIREPGLWLLLGAVALCLAGGPLPAAVKKTAGKGRLAGRVDKPKQVTAVFAKDRMSDEKDKIYPGKIDKKTGKYVITGLPLNAVYDLVIDHGGARLEGVDLKVRPSDYEEEQPLTKDDIAALKKAVHAQTKFEDKIEFMTIHGNIQYAAVLLNKLRTQPFYESKPGEVIWRLEVYHFEKPDDVWVKDQEELSIVFYRERLQKKVFDKKSLTLDAALGGHKLTAEKPSLDLGTIKLPSTKAGIYYRGKPPVVKREITEEND